jgi:Bacterial capsule synthesis protein PGA_cap
MRRHPIWLTALASAGLVAGCSGAADEPDADPRSATPPTSVTPAPTASPAASPLNRPVTIAMAGDVHFEGVLRQRLADPATALAPVTATLASADIAIVNLETSVGDDGRPEPGKRFTFHAPATAFDALAAAGVDVATMANNHALDFGREALPVTFAAIEAAASAVPRLTVVGLGRDAAEAFRPARLDVGGTVVATLGATVADTDPTADPTGDWAATATTAGTADAVDPRRLLGAVARAGRSADVVVVYVHWGVQGQRCPSEGQRSLAADLVDAGADVVVGSHAHVLQGDGRLGDGYVAYGLGNYAWYTQGSSDGADTGVLTLSVQPAVSRAGRATVTDVQWEAARIGADGLPARVDGADAERFAAERRALQQCAGLR